MLARLEGTLPAISKEPAQRMQTEEAICETRNRHAISFRNEELAQKEESLVKSLPQSLMGTSIDGDFEIAPALRKGQETERGHLEVRNDPTGARRSLRSSEKV